MPINPEKFCSLPWIGFFNQVNYGKRCCAILVGSNEPISDHLNSEKIKDVRRAFLRGEQHSSCQDCWTNENMGLKSVRNARQHLKIPVNDLTDHTFLPIKFLELRVSNLCNLACRMCNPSDSSLLAREILENPDLKKIFHGRVITDLNEITQARWEEILNLSKNLERLSITGGEPMIAKRLYDFLDYLVKVGYSKHIQLFMFTNCTVYNELMLLKMQEYKQVNLLMSIDAVGNVAEYQRYGKDWKTISNNVLKLIEMPFEFSLNVTISAYNVLDLSKLADFILELKVKNQRLQINNYFVSSPKTLQIWNLNFDLKQRAILQLRAAAEKLNIIKDFKSFVEQLLHAAYQLENRLEENNSTDFFNFIETTKLFDKSRNQNFNDIFNYKLY